jgi:hypothetical protein
VLIGVRAREGESFQWKDNCWDFFEFLQPRAPPGGGFLPLSGALTKQRGLARLEFVSFWPIRTGDFMFRLGN